MISQTNYVKYMVNEKSTKLITTHNYISAIIAFVIYIMLLIRDTRQININPNIITTVCAISFALLTINDITKLLMFCLPFSNGIFFNDITLIAFVCILCKIVSSKKINLKNIFFVLLSFLIGFYNVIVDIYSQDIKTALNLAIYFSVVSLLVYSSDKLKIESILKYFIFGTLLSIVNAIYSTFTIYSLDHILQYGVRFGKASNSIALVTSYDSNTMGFFCIVAISLIHLLEITKHIKSINSKVLTIILTILGAMSISRTYFIVLLLFAIYIIIRNINNNGIFNLAVSALLVFIIYNIFIKNSIIYGYVITQYVSRLTNSTLYNMGDRTTIFSDYINIYSGSIKLTLFGAGINGYKLLNNGISTHNGFQEVILAWGIIGFTVVASWLFILINRIRIDRDKLLGFDAYVPLIFFFIYIQTLQWFSIYTYSLLFTVSLLALKVERVD